jgi:hypothetical protein
MARAGLVQLTYEVPYVLQTSMGQPLQSGWGNGFPGVKWRFLDYLARVNSGALVLQGQRFDSPSAAAMSITGSAVNGWTFWEYKLPGQDRWQILKSLRRSA